MKDDAGRAIVAATINGACDGASGQTGPLNRQAADRRYDVSDDREIRYFAAVFCAANIQRGRVVWSAMNRSLSACRIQ